MKMRSIFLADLLGSRREAIPGLEVQDSTFAEFEDALSQWDAEALEEVLEELLSAPGPLDG